MNRNIFCNNIIQFTPVTFDQLINASLLNKKHSYLLNILVTPNSRIVVYIVNMFLFFALRWEINMPEHLMPRVIAQSVFQPRKDIISVT